jgi:kumamolisin
MAQSKSKIQPKRNVAIQGSERVAPRAAKKLGPANPKERLSVTIVLRRRPDGPPVPGHREFLQRPPGSSPRLTRDEFAAKYGASSEDIARVVEFVTSYGLSVVETHAARRTVVASGTVAQMNRAFSVELKNYQLKHRSDKHARVPATATYRSREGTILVPEALSRIVVGVFGLDNRNVTKRNMGVGDPPNTATITVPEVRRLYNFPINLATGQTIAIFSEGGYVKSDIQAYFAGLPAGFPMPVLHDIAVDAANDGSADGETTQDICIAGSAAPGADIAVYFTTYSQQGWIDLISRVVHPHATDPVCSVLSSSFYVSNGDDQATLNEEGITVSWLNAVGMAFQDAAVQRVTVCIASGDTGTESKVGDSKAHVQYPASDPWVLSVGGTTIGNVNVTTNSCDEYVWNDTFFGSARGATGGGISDYFTLPDYQKSAGVPASLNDGHVGRGVPDVAANASPNSGYPIVVGGQQNVGDGTSASAPLWAGYIAVLNAALGTNVGFVNPALYMLGASHFRDIQSPPGPSDNGLGGVAGYPAGPAWDACTGWGSMDGEAILSGLKRLILSRAVPSTVAEVLMILFGIINDGGGAYIDPSGHIHIVGPGDPGPVWSYLRALAAYRTAGLVEGAAGSGMQVLALKSLVRIATETIETLERGIAGSGR